MAMQGRFHQIEPGFAGEGCVHAVAGIGLDEQADVLVQQRQRRRIVADTAECHALVTAPGEEQHRTCQPLRVFLR